MGALRVRTVDLRKLAGMVALAMSGASKGSLARSVRRAASWSYAATAVAAVAATAGFVSLPARLAAARGALADGGAATGVAAEGAAAAAAARLRPRLAKAGAALVAALVAALAAALAASAGALSLAPAAASRGDRRAMAISGIHAASACCGPRPVSAAARCACLDGVLRRRPRAVPPAISGARALRRAAPLCRHRCATVAPPNDVIGPLCQKRVRVVSERLSQKVGAKRRNHMMDGANGGDGGGGGRPALGGGGGSGSGGTPGGLFVPARTPADAADAATKLPGALPTGRGGLFVPAKPGTSGPGTAAPGRSLLGLDTLAEQKRQAAAAAASAYQAERGSSGGNGGDEGFAVPPPRPAPQYRQPRIETPSHPGGVNQDVLDRIRERSRHAGAWAAGSQRRNACRRGRWQLADEATRAWVLSVELQAWAAWWRRPSGRRGRPAAPGWSRRPAGAGGIPTGPSRGLAATCGPPSAASGT